MIRAVFLPLRLSMLLSLLIAVAFPGTSASAQNVETVTSPDGVLSVTLSDEGGVATYAVTRLGTPVIAPSRLGFMLRGAGKFEHGLALENARRRSVDDRWEQPWGESRYVRDRYNELRVTLSESSKTKRQIDLVFRVFDDGVGFRFEFPDQPSLHDVIIDDELTEFVIARPGTAWWIPAGEWNRYEYLYNRTPVAEIGTAHTPLTIRTEDGLHLAIHEAALVDYSGMWLRKVEGQRFRAQLAPASEGWKVRRTAPFPTPWRTIQIAEDAPGLYRSSDIILNLNEPSRIGTADWFRPHKYIGLWWTMHLGQTTLESGPRHAATTENAKRYIDFAAANGIPAVLVEGWNVGFDGNWIGNAGRDFDFDRPYPDYDVDEVTAYARARGVRIIAHHETGGNAGGYEAQLGDALDFVRDHGMNLIKSGYVGDAGGVRRIGPNGEDIWEWHDGQWMSRHHLAVVEEAAGRHIAINTHEPIKDTGLRRTWPNWVSREGARGMEYNAWGNPRNPPGHEATLVFTRMLSGPMDFTPGVLSLEGQNGARIASTLTKQLALYVVLYSPIQMIADLPENLEAHPQAFEFIKAVPTDWSETRVLNGEVGRYVTFARKDRNGDSWYLGSVTDDQGRVLRVPLSFLDSGKRYRAEIYTDGANGGWQADPFAMDVERRVLTAGDMLELRLAPGGGAAVRFTPPE